MPHPTQLKKFIRSSQVSLKFEDLKLLMASRSTEQSEKREVIHIVSRLENEFDKGLLVSEVIALGICYYHGDAVSQDYQIALNNFRRVNDSCLGCLADLLEGPAVAVFDSFTQALAKQDFYLICEASKKLNNKLDLFKDSVSLFLVNKLDVVAALICSEIMDIDFTSKDLKAWMDEFTSTSATIKAWERDFKTKYSSEIKTLWDVLHFKYNLDSCNLQGSDKPQLLSTLEAHPFCQAYPKLANKMLDDFYAQSNLTDEIYIVGRSYNRWGAFKNFYDQWIYHWQDNNCSAHLLTLCKTALHANSTPEIRTDIEKKLIKIAEEQASQGWFFGPNKKLVDTARFMLSLILQRDDLLKITNDLNVIMHDHISKSALHTDLKKELFTCIPVKEEQILSHSAVSSSSSQLVTKTTPTIFKLSPMEKAELKMKKKNDKEAKGNVALENAFSILKGGPNT